MKINKAIKILERHNKWRRGAETIQQDPKEIGVAIETVINPKDMLVKFQLYLNDKGLINDYDFDYENEATKFLSKN